MNPFDHIYGIKEVAEELNITNDYLSRIFRGKDPFPMELVNGVDFKMIGKSYIISESGKTKLIEGFEIIRSGDKRNEKQPI